MKKVISLLIFLSFSIPVMAIAPDDVLGIWYTEAGKSQVEIYKEKDRFNGRIVWLKEPLYPSSDPKAGQTKTDDHNPDKNRNNDPILGLELIKGFTFDKGANKWANGTIYNPEDGKIYNCYMLFNENNDLFVRGFIDPWGLLGKTQTWTRTVSGNR